MNKKDSKKRVAIISFHCQDTSIPLAKHIHNSDINVDMYLMLPKGSRSRIFDFSELNEFSGMLSQSTVDSIVSPQMKEYLDGLSIKIIFVEPYSRRNILKYYYQISIICKSINKKRYDAIHLIGHDKPLVAMYRFLRGKNLIHSLHESTKHDLSVPEPYQKNGLLELLIKRHKIKLIFHSRATMDRFITYKNFLNKYSSKAGTMKVIPFGVAETYKLYDNNEKDITIDDNDFIVLFYGRIELYKGVQYLIEAFNKYLFLNNNIKLIIAGKGDLNCKVNSKNIKIINKHLTDQEIVDLHKKSHVTICPYTSASQSGVVISSFLFLKPVIATNVGGFSEYIKHNLTGFIIEPNSSESIANAIILLSNDKEKYKEMQENIYKIYFDNESAFSWKNIANSTIDFYGIK